jgi:hypothetical protein
VERDNEERDNQKHECGENGNGTRMCNSPSAQSGDIDITSTLSKTIAQIRSFTFQQQSIKVLTVYQGGEVRQMKEIG